MTVKISQLPAGAALTGVEEVPVVQSSATVRTLVSAIGTYVRGLFTVTPLTIAEGGTGEGTQSAALTALLGNSQIPIANGGTGATTAALARAALSAAKSGANSDITSILGLTTALSVGQGGTGATNASSALLALGAIGTVKQTVMLSSATYTPTANTIFAFVQLQAAGGGGGGSFASVLNGGGGGGAGGFTQFLFGIATIGSGAVVTLGAAGVGVTGANGTDALDSSFGALLLASGGAHGLVGANNAAGSGGIGGSSSLGSLNIAGQDGGIGFNTSSVAVSGEGGASLLGFGGASVGAAGSGSPGKDGKGYGGGGGGSMSVASGVAQAGGSGSGAICIITEFITA